MLSLLGMVGISGAGYDKQDTSIRYSVCVAHTQMYIHWECSCRGGDGEVSKFLGKIVTRDI